MNKFLNSSHVRYYAWLVLMTANSIAVTFNYTDNDYKMMSLSLFAALYSAHCAYKALNDIEDDRE